MGNDIRLLVTCVKELTLITKRHEIKINDLEKRVLKLEQKNQTRESYEREQNERR